MPLPELERWVAAVTGDPPSRARQLFRVMYAPARGFISDLADAGPGSAEQDTLSPAFLAAAADAGATADPGLALAAVRTSGDGTRKLVFDVTAGAAAGRRVDAVLIPDGKACGARGRRRLTLCVSSQAGCAMGCAFCLTGASGLGGSLTAGQIVEQVVAARRLLASEGADPSLLSNVVFMGQGEPLDNYDAVVAAADVMTCATGLALSHNRVTVSTVGLVPAMRALAAASPVQLAVSLHATTEAGRAAIVPANARHPLADIVAALEADFPRRPAAAKDGPASAATQPPPGPHHRHGRHVLIEYVLLAGVNDAAADARRLVSLLARVEAKINLIPFNPHPGSPFSAPDDAAVSAFRGAVRAGGRVCTVRAAKGADAALAACGQLGDPAAGTRRAGRGVSAAV